MIKFLKLALKYMSIIFALILFGESIAFFWHQELAPAILSLIFAIYFLFDYRYERLKDRMLMIELQLNETMLDKLK